MDFNSTGRRGKQSDSVAHGKYFSKNSKAQQMIKREYPQLNHLTLVKTKWNQKKPPSFSLLEEILFLFFKWENKKKKNRDGDPCVIRDPTIFLSLLYTTPCHGARAPFRVILFIWLFSFFLVYVSVYGLELEIILCVLFLLQDYKKSSSLSTSF